jgi:hypothetical protein
LVAGDAEEEAEAPAETPAPAKPTARKTTGSKTPDRAAQLSEEVQLLRQAQQAIGQGQPSRALELLREHAQKHPKGVLSQERAGVQAIALCQAGSGTQQAEAFLKSNPNSPLAERMRAACGLSK